MQPGKTIRQHEEFNMYCLKDTKGMKLHKQRLEVIKKKRMICTFSSMFVSYLWDERNQATI